MSKGTYTAPERVVRDGRVVCFKGEVMTEAEAERRGLLAAAPEPEPEPEAEPAVPPAEAEPDPRRAAVDARIAELVDGNNADELRAMAEALGCELPKGATKPVVARVIAEAEAAEAGE